MKDQLEVVDDLANLSTNLTLDTVQIKPIQRPELCPAIYRDT
ncbi:hypothetical protein [Paenibacillus rhizolycopersici]|nr:hypothetical protein [Paenibacillus timonensis]